MEKPKEGAEEMVIMPLGGGQEVGRSCILLQYQGRNILLDCGCHPGREGSDGLPFFDSLDSPEDIDLVLITHFHIDHCAALPYFTEKTNFKGRIFMTHASKAVMKLLLSDNIRLQHRTAPLYSEQDLQNCIDKIEVLDYHETVEYKGIKFSATAAGHVLGAAMFMIDIDSIRVLYTGDYSLEEDRHLFGAEVPPGGPPDVMIVESTFGTADLPSRESRELQFTTAVESIVMRGGSCLIPVFALGRAQELLLILDQYWQEHVQLQNVPIFYASKLATKSLRVYQTFINMMNNQVRDLMDQFDNPFKLKHIKSIHNNNDFAMLGPCVVMASPGFMQSGVSRQLFEAWCDDPRHGVVIAGYTIEGTLANDLLSAPTEIKCLDNRIKPLRCQVEHISFSAHVDYTENKTFIKRVMPDYIILVHGEKTQMKRLKEGLESDMRKNLWPTQHKPSVAMPENGVKVKLRFRKNVLADVVGSAASTLMQQLECDSTTESHAPTVPQNALLVTENFNSKLVAASELSNFTSCKFGRIKERLTVPIPPGLDMLVGPVRSAAEAEAKVMDLLVCHLEEVFDSLTLSNGGGNNSDSSSNSGGVNGNGNGLVPRRDSAATRITIQSLVTLSVGYTNANFSDGMHSTDQASEKNPTHVLIEWIGSPIADTVADCAAGLVLQAFSAFNSLRRSVTSASNPRSRNNRHKRQKVDSGSSSLAHGDSSGSISEIASETKSSDLLTKMMKGEIDPTKQIKEEHARDPVKLQALIDLIMHGPLASKFSSVKANKEGDKLIFRSLPHVQYEVSDLTGEVSVVPQQLLVPEGEMQVGTNEFMEAFVFVQFGEGSNGDAGGEGSAELTHNAVVHCEDEHFRRAVIQALKIA